ncbi:MAG: hypothetical protein IPI35_13925 [Deltaproteobacteria bacterium]|nr:hypothetical protein [Deltaproteobacteria bacterium]
MPSLTKTGPAVVAFVSAIVATGCDKEPPPLTPEEQLARVQARGPWAVGVHVLELTYDDPADDAPRTLRVTVWAPSPDTEGQSVEYRGLFESDGAWDEASLAEGPSPWCSTPTATKATPRAPAS